LRNNESFDALNTFFDEIKWIQRRFIIADGVKNFVGSFAMYGKSNGYNGGNPYLKINRVFGAEHNSGETMWVDKSWSESYIYDEYSGFEDLSFMGKLKANYIPGYLQYNHDNYLINGICFRSRDTSKKLKTFDITVTYSLSELEKISDFTVEHSSKYSRLSQWYNGGSIFYEDSNYVLIQPIGKRPMFSFKVEQYCRECQGDDRDNNCPDLRLCPITNYHLTKLIGDLYKNTFTDTLIGSGLNNTKKIGNIYDSLLSPFKYVQSKVINSYSDWFIPSKNEAYHLVEYWRKYFKITGFDLNRNIMTSSLSKGKKYDDNWDSFFEIKEFDAYNQSLNIYYQPIMVKSTQLFSGQMTYFYPIRLEKKK
jgi:hypothetical protein